MPARLSPSRSTPTGSAITIGTRQWQWTRLSQDWRPSSSVGSKLGPSRHFVRISFFLARLTATGRNTRTGAAYAVYPLFGGGVAEWLKAAVC
jgi:hypothetical protein